MATEPEDDPADAMAAGALQVTAGVGDTVNSAHSVPATDRAWRPTGPAGHGDHSPPAALGALHFGIADVADDKAGR